MARPSATPRNAAGTKPLASESRLEAPALASVPVLTRPHQASATALAGGTKIVSSMRPRISQTASSAPIAAKPPRPNAGSWTAANFIPSLHLLQDLPELVHQAGELAARAHVERFARPRQRHLEYAVHLARAGAEHHHAVGKIDRLFHAVGDEDHGLALLGPHA